MPGSFFSSFPAGGSGVKSLNGMTGDLNLVAGSGITIVDTAGTITISSSGGSGANTTLSNLTSPTAVNQNLSPDTSSLRDLGDATHAWSRIYLNDIKDSNDTFILGGLSRTLTSTASNAMIDFSTSGVINLFGNLMSNALDPVDPADLATKNYVDTHPTGANSALSNLSATSINQDLLPSTNDSRSIGSSSNKWSNILVDSSVGTGLQLWHSVVQRATVRANITTPTGATDAVGIIGVGNSLGSFVLASSNNSAASASPSNSILIETGNKTAGTGNSGDIAMTIGTSSGGTVGSIKLNGTTAIGKASTTLQHTMNTASTTGAQTGTLTNVPGAAGPKDPTGYIQITINGTTSYIPYFQ